MTPDTLHWLVAELRRERFQEAEHARLATSRRTARARGFVPRFGETIGHLLAAHRRPATR